MVRPPRRGAPLLVLALLIVVIAGNLLGAHEPYAVPPGPIASAACRQPAGYVERVTRGLDLKASGDIQLIPHYPDFVSSRGVTHAGPWTPNQHVPLFLYGPGYIRRGVLADRSVTLAGVAPTIAKLVGFRDRNWFPAEGTLDEALIANPPTKPPRLILTVVWDTGGRSVLAKFPNIWPNLAKLERNGTWFDKATVGSSPSVTAPAHATIGTGVFPDRVGIVDDVQRTPDGSLADPWAHGPGTLHQPTIADLYDRDENNHPLIGAVATQLGQLGMLGHGSSFRAGDRDIAAVKVPSNKLPSWRIPRSAGGGSYSYPKYVEKVPGPARDLAAVDAADGFQNGAWETHVIQGDRAAFETPAQVPYETRVVTSIVGHERFGGDDTPDLLFVNYGIMETMEGRFGLNSLEMRDALGAADASLPDLVKLLNDAAGRGRWVMILTADHGTVRTPEVTGAFRIDQESLQQDVEQRFGKVVERTAPTQIWMDVPKLRAQGHTLNEVARYLLKYTERDNRKVRGPNARSPVFDLVIPSNAINRLPCVTS